MYGYLDWDILLHRNLGYLDLGHYNTDILMRDMLLHCNVRLS